MIPLEQQCLFLTELRTGPGFIGWKAPSAAYQQDTFQTTDEA